MNWFLLSVLSLLMCNGVWGWMVKMSLEDLVKEADHIVIGTVTETESSWDADGRWIRTYVSLSIDDSIKCTSHNGDSPGKQCMISYIGGVVGDIGLYHSDTPHFKKGQRVLVFLRPDERGTFRVVGRCQGKFTIEGNKIVEKNIDTDAFVRRIKTMMKD